MAARGYYRRLFDEKSIFLFSKSFIKGGIICKTEIPSEPQSTKRNTTPLHSLPTKTSPTTYFYKYLINPRTIYQNLSRQISEKYFNPPISIKKIPSKKSTDFQKPARSVSAQKRIILLKGRLSPKPLREQPSVLWQKQEIINNFYLPTRLERHLSPCFKNNEPKPNLRYQQYWFFIENY